MANGDGTHGAAAAFDSYQEVAAPKMEHQPSDTVHLMSRIQVGPPVITIHEGRTFMVTTRASEVSPDAEQGLFAEDTRLISRYQLLIDKTPWTQVTAAGVSYFGADYVFLSPRFKSPDGTVEPGKIELRLQRAISEGGAHEDFEITNYSQGEVQFQFSISSNPIAPIFSRSNAIKSVSAISIPSGAMIGKSLRGITAAKTLNAAWSTGSTPQTPSLILPMGRSTLASNLVRARGGTLVAPSFR